MTEKMFNSPEIINALFDFYEEDLKLLCISNKTASPQVLPKTTEGRAQLLNLYLYQPEFGLVWGNSIAFSQIDFYRAYLSDTKKRFAIFAKDLKNKSRNHLKLKGIPVFTFTKDFNPINYLYGVKSLSGLLYVSHKANNLKYINNLKDIIHVYSGHGNSEKHTSSFRIANVHDFVMRTDLTAAMKFVENGVQLTMDRFLLIGGTPVPGTIYEKEPSSKLENILYIPTWEGHSDEVNFSSEDESMYNAIQSFLNNENYSFQIKEHPGFGSKKKELKEISTKFKNLSFFIKQKSKSSLFNWSDIAITDISGVLPEYLFTGKPIIIPVDKESWKYKYIQETNLIKHCYIWFYKEVSLKDFLQSIKHDPLREFRIQIRDKLFLRAESVEDLSEIFENALTHIQSTYLQRELKRLHSDTYLKHYLNKQEKLNKMPEDLELQKCIQEIRSGKNFLEVIS